MLLIWERVLKSRYGALFLDSMKARFKAGYRVICKCFES